MIRAFVRSNPVLRETARSLRKRIFLFIKKISFKVLGKLDPSFETNIRQNFIVSTEEVTTSDFAAETKSNPAKAKGLQRAVVLNSNDVVATPEVVNFFMAGLFKSSENRSFVWESIKPQLTAGLTVAELEQLIDNRLSGLLKISSDNLQVLECYQIFLEHKENTRRCETAYLKEGKPKPSAVFWPVLEGQSVYNELPYVRKFPIVDRSTPLGSAGSCFASEIAKRFQKEGFNYVLTEKPIGVENSYRFMAEVGQEITYPPSCAAWGTIFNTPSFRQLVEKAFEVRQLPKILWVEKPQGIKRFYDPFRENIEFASPEAFEENYESHRTATREAFLKSKVFVITLGLNEVWYFKADGSVFSRSPWRIAPSLIEFRTLTVEENVADLQRMLDILRVHNKDMHLIVTLSPIGLSATFRADKEHIITANAHSKAILRVAAEEFVKRNKNVSYFPSYEMVNFCVKDAFDEHLRNVKPGTVDRVMNLFKEIYVH